MIQNDYYKIVLIDSTTGSTGNYAELDCEGIDFSTTFQVADIADITTRKDAITKTISFKGTKNNNIIFGNISNFNRYVDESISLPILFNFDITKAIDCQVYENSTLILEGQLNFISTSRDAQGNINYDCDIEGYAIGLFQQIQNSLISDLDFSQFNHTYDIENIVNSWSNTYVNGGNTIAGNIGEGYVYPCIDYGEGITDDTAFDNLMDYRNFRPAFFVREYFNAIFNQSGLTDTYTYTVTGSTAFIEEFNKCIVPNNDSDFSYTLQPYIIFGVTKTSNPQTYNGSKQTHYDSTNNRTEYNNLVGFDTTTTGGTGQTIISTSVIGGEKIVFNNKISTTVTASVTFQAAQFINGSATYRFQCLYRSTDLGQFNSIAEVTKTYSSTSEIVVTTHPVVITYPPDTLNLTLTNDFEEGSEMAFAIYIDSAQAEVFNVTILTAQAQFGSDSSTSQVTVKIGDAAILVGQNTQTISQTDFIKSYINMFNLYVYPDLNNPKNIIFIPYNDFYSNFTPVNIIENSIDWSNKIDNSSITQTPVSDLFDLYTFNFTDDTDYFSLLYKERFGDTYGNLILTGTTNGSDKSLDLIFGSTPVANYANRNVPYLWELDTNNLKKVKVTVPRILFYNGLVDCPAYEIGTISLSASTQTYYFSSIDALNVSAYTFSQYAEVNEFTISSDGEFADLTFGTPLQVFYTNGGILSSYGSGKKTLYDRYYADYITELTDSNTRVVQVSAYLNELDIQNLDFTKPIYLDTVLGHNYFKLLSVEYSNKTEPATVMLQTAYIRDSNTAFGGFYNDTESMYFTKTGCPTGYTGESFLYAVPYGKYNSLASQTDADNMAIAEMMAYGQTYISTYALCVNTGTTFTLGYGFIPAYANTATTSTYYTDSGNLSTGSTLFYTLSGQTVRGYNGYYSDGTTIYETNESTTIIATGLTSSISATTYDAYFIGGANQYVTCQSANQFPPNLINYQISDPYPRIGTIVKDADGVILVPDGWYATKFTSYQTVSGVITATYSCTTTLGSLL